MLHRSLLTCVSSMLLAVGAFAQEQNGLAELRVISPCRTSDGNGWALFRKNSPYITEAHEVCFGEISEELRKDLKKAETFLIVIDGHRDKNERKGISLTRANFAKLELTDKLSRWIKPSQIIVRNFSDTCPRQKEHSFWNRRNEYWMVSGAGSIGEIDKVKSCQPGSTSRVVTNEKPVRWTGRWITWQWEVDPQKKPASKSKK